MATEEQQKEATGHGWVPKETFKGDPAKWVDADVFLERAETFIPFLNKTKRTLEQRLQEERTARDKLQQEHEALRQSVKALEKIREQDTAADRESLRADVKARLAAAAKDGDGEAVAELSDQLAQLSVAPAKPDAGTEDDAPAAPAAPPVHPAFAPWREKNPWFGVDEEKSDYALYQATRIRRLEPDLKGEAFYEKVSTAVDEHFNPKPKHAKVDTSTLGGGGSGSSSNGKGYNDLPAEAKAIVADEARFRVGPDKNYKTLTDWQNYYAKVFFSQALKP